MSVSGIRFRAGHSSPRTKREAFRHASVCDSMPLYPPWQAESRRGALAVVIASDLRTGMIVEVVGQLHRVLSKKEELIRIEVATGRYLERVKESGKR